jgi:2-phospho-L-lactate guanylyltransferase
VIIAAIPVKSFGVAKARLASRLDAAARSRLGKAVAARTAIVAADAGFAVAIVTADADVSAWARGLGFLVIAQDLRTDPGLDGAAACAVRVAAEQGAAWSIIHADLPVVTAADLRVVQAAVERGPVIAPSHDAGTNLLAGSDPEFAFSYGPGSFHRHFAVLPRSTVINRPGLALDLDTPEDLDRVLRMAAGRWVHRFVP